MVRNNNKLYKIFESSLSAHFIIILRHISVLISLNDDDLSLIHNIAACSLIEKPTGKLKNGKYFEVKDEKDITLLFESAQEFYHKTIGNM